MKYVDEYRDSKAARQLLAEIRRSVSKCWTIMEVCGGQTHALLRHGIEAELEGVVELIHGPGCPVFVTPVEAIDFAQELAARPGVLVASFGDMLRVPGSVRSLLEVRAVGGNVQAVYSPLDAIELAKRNPQRQVVFFAVGFETTAPATALAVQQAAQLGLDNFSLLVAHVRVQPAMEAIAKAPDCRVQAFLAAGHVCTVMGYESYFEFAGRYRLPIVVTGFEPIDLLEGIRKCAGQLERGEAEVANCYGRSVRAAGNPAARDVVQQVYEVCNRPWRGLGVIEQGGLRLRSEFERFDAERRFAASNRPIAACNACRSGEVLTGKIKPPQCPSFAVHCTPDRPLGAPMVSSEGACAAYYHYRPVGQTHAVREG